MTFEILQSNLEELNNHLELLDTKLRSLEIISDNTFFEIYLLSNQMNMSLSDSFIMT